MLPIRSGEDRVASSFARNVLTLLSATAVSQAVPILISPFLTRLYPPSSFGVLALFVVVSGFISIISAGRYELAILIPERDEQAVSILQLCVIMVLGTSLLSLVVLWMIRDPLVTLLRSTEISKWILLIPLMVLLMGVYQAVTAWANRRRMYRMLAVNRVIQSAVTAAVTLGMGFGGLESVGLIIGSLCGQSIATVLLILQVWKNSPCPILAFGLSAIKAQAIGFIRFPLYSVLTDLINLVVNQAPVIFLSRFFGAAQAGYYDLTQRTLGTPVSMVGRAFAEVFKERASREFREGGNCQEVFLKTARMLALLSVPVFLCFMLGGPQLFSLVFGTNWRPAGECARALSLMFLFKFVAGPLSYVYYLAGRQVEDLCLHIYIGVSSIALLCAGHALLSDFTEVMLAFAVNYSAVYVVYLLRSYSFCRTPRSKGALLGSGDEVPAGGGPVGHL